MLTRAEDSAQENAQCYDSRELHYLPGPKATADPTIITNCLPCFALPCLPYYHPRFPKGAQKSRNPQIIVFLASEGL
jgi:hypothetical protein